ncbi:helix-turn-helix transcriptional regulator [Paenibacillus larvae]|uniref:Helix-turn-helix protein n=1 Tax=Paenibacillus larvae subsp. larvae TaxID=147375 RepID=A0A2L1U784_9BACL|nr:helix-turn-helix transcriptional regulator [Paenibacillus larvae]AVF28799.1 helix-turn-helix protein [Paenibacillus larvae subsp. larvae]MCY9499061.1 helix-turn-helix transcriptional regulator [Paenibacillus larvae]MCY9745350.1 helix-turn-helix transcriptional regulator [Paenibacillus larvae]MCY9750218.1 helix-turn-helix transcriptional regulator [Paenibacillus larvae]MDR5608815.1 helix-turn-helix transcriptional regulator [Paenibacillus larvae]
MKDNRTLIRKLREIQLLTIQDVATDLGLPVSSLTQIETCKKGTNAIRAQVIADYFGKPIDDLFEPKFYLAKWRG